MKIDRPNFYFIGYKMSSIVIRLLRHGQSAANDDLIKISPSIDLFKIQYHDGQSGYASFFYASELDTVRYVEDLFYLLVDDNDPFSNIQFSFPCFPSVIYKIPDFDTNVIRHTIRERLIATLQNWPERVRE